MFNAPLGGHVKYSIVKKKRAHRKDEATIYSTTNDFKINFNSQSKKTAFDESTTFNDPSGDERQYDICGIKHLTYDLIYHGKATRQFDQGFFGTIWTYQYQGRISIPLAPRISTT